MKRNEVDRNKITPMMAQYMEIKDNYEDVILMFRLGDFYEMFFEDAELVSHELELVLTGKNAGLDERIPMCGVPHHAANNYIDKLIEKGYKVAICEQVEDPKEAKGVVKREVQQIISKGTVMSGELLDEKSNNYIGNIMDFNHCYIVCYTDISTGEFNALMIEHDINSLVSEIVSMGIKEAVLADNVDKSIIDILRNKFKMVVSVYENIEDLKEYRYLYEDITDIRYIETVKHLLTYLNDTQKRSLDHLQKVIIKDYKESLKMDIYTKRNLELVENSRLKSRNYSLLWLLDKTKTAMGSRTLKRWIENPLTNKVEIEKRYDVVEILLEEFILKEELQGLLYEVYDLERLSGRIAYGNANAKDLLQLKKSLRVLPDIKNILEQIKFYKKLNTLDNVYEMLENSIYENPPLGLKEGYLIKDGYNSDLDDLKENRRGGTDFIVKMETEERNRTGIKNLKVGFNKVFGYYIEVSKGNIGLIPEDAGYERKQTLANCERYITPILKEKEALILGAEEKIVELEYNLFIKIRDEVKKYIHDIQDIAKTISEIDVLTSFAVATEKNNYIRPIITDDRNVSIKDSRHPVVEKVMTAEFVPNDIILDEKTDILLITGPNMAGKSTYMRQFAMVIIMAQIGCFVPCKSASMPIFDKIFTRIGASDDLVSGESTFMVEMIEANNALINATPNSLVLFDELGRGTATYDGMSLAQAIIEYIHDHVKCKTLFSTHYHELVDLENTLANVKNVHVSAFENDGNITFLHKIKDGSIDKSYGIHVAKLAKLPSSLIKRANEILSVYESKEKKNLFVQEELKFETVEKNEYNDIIDKIKELNPLDVSPMEALNILYNLKKEVEEKSDNK
ncbi:MAG: DNA mismatch repair protein MutS [Bacilli bacterium]|nr:DNA mismatch repair protein MutS [Bacilli bacterium]MDD3305258.1 DNA mismatch repair protein MutS [Bacilli bacterium]MDD4053946.1 DNA mismatch repair protein MutS [Bacilli bacterium]MDD4411206.1 DNA mismatch repair protein MutS [Bacilli bacterium]